MEGKRKARHFSTNESEVHEREEGELPSNRRKKAIRFLIGEREKRNSRLSPEGGKRKPSSAEEKESYTKRGKASRVLRGEGGGIPTGLEKAGCGWKEERRGGTISTLKRGKTDGDETQKKSKSS